MRNVLAPPPPSEGCRPRRTDPLFAARAHQIDCWATARENLPREPNPRSGHSIHDRGEFDDRTRCRRNSDRPVGGPANNENRSGPKPIVRACGCVPWLPNGAARRLYNFITPKGPRPIEPVPGFLLSPPSAMLRTKSVRRAGGPHSHPQTRSQRRCAASSMS